MNNLDRKIAELKGWEIVTAAEYEKLTGRDAYEAEVAIRRVAPGAITLAGERGDERWSRSDAKALELVDELIKSHPGIGINITRERQTGRWMVALCPGDWVHGEGPTRPEAICRAYIAAREWTATKAPDLESLDAKQKAHDRAQADREEKFMEGSC